MKVKYFPETLDTYLLLELKNANKYKSEDLSAFEAEVREAIYNICPNSYPMVVSSLHGKETLKPGPFIKHNSKIFISRFNSQSEVAAVWNSGKVYANRLNDIFIARDPKSRRCQNFGLPYTILALRFDGFI